MTAYPEGEFSFSKEACSARISSRLEALPEREGIERIWQVIPQARLVGGCVRDFLCGRAVHDIDLASPLPPQEAADILEKAGLKVVPTGLAHGTLTVVHQSRPYELTTLRRDVETDGRHAIVAWTESWREDAARRDFTINAMSFDRSGQLHDYFGGVEDLQAGRVRFVGTAKQRIEEDALRALRFFRFEARYGMGLPDAEAVAAITQTTELTRPLSAERVASELLKIMAAPRLLPTLHLMESTGLLRVLLPQAKLEGLEQLLACVTTQPMSAPPLSPEALLRLYALCPDPGLGARLKLSRNDQQRLQEFAKTEPALSPEMISDALRRAAAEQAPELLHARTWLVQAHLLGRPDKDWDILRQKLAGMERPVFPLTGKDGLACGLRPGQALGEWLRQARTWWLSEGCRPSAEECRAWLAQAVRGAQEGQS